MEKYFCSYSQEHTIPGDFTEGPKELHASSGQGEASMDPFAKQKVIVDYAKIGLSTVKQLNGCQVLMKDL